MKNNEHLNNLLPIVREKLNLSNDDRKEFILEEKWITYPNAKEILDKLEFLYKHPKKSRMPCMLIVGETNNGKTSIINKFLKNNPPYEAEEVTITPILGIKYLVWNRPDGRSVHLESWIDSVSGGDPSKAVWSKVGEVVDSGQWPGAASAIQGCSYADSAMVILPGHGTMLMRTDGDTAQYRMVSLREIVPPSSGVSVAPRRQVSWRRRRLVVSPGRGGLEWRVEACDAAGRAQSLPAPR